MAGKGKRKAPGNGQGPGAGLSLQVSATGATPLQNIRHERFAVAVAEGHSKSQAYRLAYQRPKPSSHDSGSAWKLMQKDPIRQRIAYLKGLLAEAAKDRKVAVINELEKIGFANISDVVTWDSKGRPTLKPSADLTPDQLAAIGSIKQTRVGLSVELHSKLQALKELAEIHGAYPEQQTGAGVTVMLVVPPKMDRDEWLATYGRGRGREVGTAEDD